MWLGLREKDHYSRQSIAIYVDTIQYLETAILEDERITIREIVDKVNISE